MRAFHCAVCGMQLFFENSQCLRCGTEVGVGDGEMVALVPDGPWRRCGDAAAVGCNWLLGADEPGELCRSCRLTRTRPADADAGGLAQWAEAERAKRRLIHQLDGLGLRVWPRSERPDGLAFDLLSSRDERVVTGHADGVITLDLAEADDLHREQVRLELDEPYRTVLGHLRHEIGHYWWPLLVTDPADLEECRSLFGDDRQDYAEALQRHYQRPAVGWEDDHISRYATMHPYEDWAETFAHLLHVLDLLETAEAWALRPGAARRPGEDLGGVVARWLDLSYALNQMNRSIGREDLYPFVITGPVLDKLRFVDRMVGLAGAG